MGKVIRIVSRGVAVVSLYAFHVGYFLHGMAFIPVGGNHKIEGFQFFLTKGDGPLLLLVVLVTLVNGRHVKWIKKHPHEISRSDVLNCL